MEKNKAEVVRGPALERGFGLWRVERDLLRMPRYAIVLCACPSVCVTMSLYVCEHVCQSVSLSVSLSICLSVCLSVGMCVCIYVHHVKVSERHGIAP